MSAGERTVERYKQDSNVFILLIATKASSDVAALSSNEMDRLKDSAKMKSSGCSIDHCPKRSATAVADNP
jgi:hypothetical protein